MCCIAGGRHTLIGGADSGSQLSSDLGRLAGPMNRRLDALGTALREIGSIERAAGGHRTVSVSQAYWAVTPPGTRPAERVNQSLTDIGIEPALLSPGMELQLDRGILLRVLAADEGGAALQVEYGNLCLLWPNGFAPEELNRSGRRLRGCLCWWTGIWTPQPGPPGSRSACCTLAVTARKGRCTFHGQERANRTG